MIAGAPLVAATQVLVYIGAISVLVLFAIMLTQTKAAPSRLVFQTQAGPAAVAGVLLAIVIGLGVALDHLAGQPAPSATDTKDRRARRCSARSSLPFEIVSVLLLAAVIGGVFLAKREHGDVD